MHKALALTALGKHADAVPLYDRALVIYEHLVEHENRGELAGDLASVLMHKAIALGTLENVDSAEPFGLAIAIYRHLVDREGRSELAEELAKALGYKAVVMLAVGEQRRGPGVLRPGRRHLRAPRRS